MIECFIVGCDNGMLSENYAKQLYTRKYLRDTSVTGRLGDMSYYWHIALVFLISPLSISFIGNDFTGINRFTHWVKTQKTTL
jgi:hypothetical protein